MNYNSGHTNETDKTGDVIHWAIVIILLFVIPPIGILLLLAKLGVFSGGSKSSTNKDVIITNKKRKRLERKTGRGLSIFLLIVAIFLFIAGASIVLAALSNWTVANLGSIAELGFGAFWLLGGFIALFSRNIVAKKLIRYKHYFAYIDGHDIMPLSSIAQTAGVSMRVIIRDIQDLINNGYLNPGAYIDNELECLVLSAEAAHKLRSELMDTPDHATQNASTASSEDDHNSANTAHLAEFRRIRLSIKDETISEKISHLEKLSAKIFKIVEESPEKQPQIRRFMSYYIPTTLKLIRSYATLESQGIKGENIMSTKQNISNILDTLSIGYEQQLDQLFKSDAIDIASDISVLENLMKQDGLTGTSSFTDTN